VRLLALEHSGRTVSAALVDGRETHELRAPREEGGEALLGFVDRLLRKTGLSGPEIDALVCGIGPGSYTGIRVALGLAQGLARSWNRPLLGLSGSEALARRALERAGSPLPVLVALAAGLGEVARLWYRPEEEVRPEDHGLLTADLLRHEGAASALPFVAIGSGLPCSPPQDWDRCRLYLPEEEATARDYLPLVSAARVERASPVEDVHPLYLRAGVRTGA
jgi:tRNA threonylcarbamoyladenosine biosynthesis protein TsaB